MITFLGILLYILSEMLFSEYAPEKSTNWSVFYFVANFISFFMISLDQFIKSFDKFTRWVSVLFMSFFMIVIIQFSLQINKPYEIYRTCVNDSFIDLLRYGFFAVALILICLNYITKWAKR